MLAMVSSNRLDLPKTNRHEQSFYIQYCIQSIGPKCHLVFNRSIQRRSLNFFSLFAQAVPCSLDLFNAVSFISTFFYCARLKVTNSIQLIAPTSLIESFQPLSPARPLLANGVATPCACRTGFGRRRRLPRMTHLQRPRPNCRILLFFSITGQLTCLIVSTLCQPESVNVF
jgi:hypothetical protein